jgi:hypothetical protein
MSLNPELSLDPSDPSARIYTIYKPYGAVVPLTFGSIRYLDTKPTDATGLQFQLIIKNDPDADDSTAIIDARNADLVIGSEPLTVAYNMDSTLAGFSKGGIYYAELWVDGPLGLDRLAKMNITLTDPYKENFN